MKIRETQRGFAMVEFSDLYDHECSLQKSSLATEDCIWLGVHENRMHLTQEQVKELLPYLQRFAETGEFTKEEATNKIVASHEKYNRLFVAIKDALVGVNPSSFECIMALQTLVANAYKTAGWSLVDMLIRQEKIYNDVMGKVKND